MQIGLTAEVELEKQPQSSQSRHQCSKSRNSPRRDKIYKIYNILLIHKGNSRQSWYDNYLVYLLGLDKFCILFW